MPIYTQAQTYALSVLRELLSLRHDQMHWLMGMEYPDKKRFAAGEMRRLNYLGKVVNDGQYYYWPGCGLDMELITALDFMKRASGSEKPFYAIQTPPCKLAFSVFKGDRQHSCGIFFPKPGEEWTTSVAAEQLPKGQTPAIFLEDRRHIPRINIYRPHIFVCPDGKGGYEYIRGQSEGGG